MNKVTFITEPDLVDSDSFALINYSNTTIKNLLNVCNQNIQFYLLEANKTDTWRQKIKSNITKTFDCSNDSLAYILEHVGQK